MNLKMICGMHLSYGHAVTVNVALHVVQACVENIQTKVKDITYMFI